MAKPKPVLRLRIEQNGHVLHKNLHGKARFSVGKSPDNDLSLVGEIYPRQHNLFARKGDGYVLNLPSYAKGEIVAKNARLRFSDLIVHGLLPKNNGYYRVNIIPGRMGYIFLDDDTRIDFAVERKAIQKIKFAGFSPVRVFFKGLLDDALFRFIVLVLFMLNAGMLYGLRDYVPAPKKAQPIDQATRRLARFVVKAPEPPKPPPAVKTAQSAAAEESTEPEPKTEPKKKDASKEPTTEPKKQLNPENVGVLALLGGTGETGASNSVVDFLLSKDLAAGLDDVTRSKKLTVGKKGSGEDEETTDKLLAALSTGGIDDLIGGLDDEVESVTLEKKGTVQVDRLGGLSGSKEALGARTEESLRAVLVENMGRLTYIYNKYLKRNPEFRGEMRVEVTIGAAGQVTAVKLLASTMGNPAFEREILAAVRRFRYDPIATGIVRVEYPIIFNKVM